MELQRCTLTRRGALASTVIPLTFHGLQVPGSYARSAPARAAPIADLPMLKYVWSLLPANNSCIYREYLCLVLGYQLIACCASLEAWKLGSSHSTGNIKALHIHASNMSTGSSNHLLYSSQLLELYCIGKQQLLARRIHNLKVHAVLACCKLDKRTMHTS